MVSVSGWLILLVKWIVPTPSDVIVPVTFETPSAVAVMAPEVEIVRFEMVDVLPSELRTEPL